MNKTIKYPFIPLFKEFKNLIFIRWLHSLAITASIIIIFILNLLFFPNISWAKVIHIKVSEAKDIGIKLVILPFNGATNYNHYNEITDVIVNDLNYSGLFKVLELYSGNHATIEKIPNNAKEIDFKFWRETGAEYLLMTKIYPDQKVNNLVVNLQLVDLYKPLNPVSFNIEIIKLPNENHRKLAHKISSVIFEKLTGIKSFFNTKIAYIRSEHLGESNPSYSLNVADFDGYNEHKLISTPYPLMSPNWSPDGKKISFVSFKGNRANISIANLVTGKINIITNYPGINGAPAWSPQGDKLAIVLSKEGTPQIYILNMENNHLQKITNSMSIDTEPCWNNNGTEIFFTSNRGGKPQIYKTSLYNPKNIQRITFTGDYNTTPSLTPDNRFLVMLHCQQNCSKREGEFKVAIQSLENGKVRILTKTGMEDSPTISPNGGMVLYSTERYQNTNKLLAGVSIDGNFIRYLSIGDNGSISSPAWSPFLE